MDKYKMLEGFVLKDMWTPNKELRSRIESVLSGLAAEPLKDLDVCLQKNKQNFLNLLKNPPKSAKDREEVKKGSTDGINLPDLGHQVLSKELVDEAIIISDMYDLNEYVALDLLCTAQHQMSRHPDLPRGLVAVLLYYDGRLSLVQSLRLLVQSRSGLAWKMDISPAVADYITDYTDKLMADGILNKILDVLDSMDLAKELELLQQNRALGGPKHHRDVVEMMEGIRQVLADIVYCWAVQSGFPREPTLRLLQQLRKTKIEEEFTGGIDSVTLALQMAMLFALDLSVLQYREDGEEAVERLPLLSDPEFIGTLHRELKPVASKQWECAGLQALTQMAWGLVLATVKLTHHGHQGPGYQSQGLLDDDDTLIESAINLGVFNFLQQTFLANKTLFKEEWYLRRLHSLVTDFVVYMPLKVKDLRNRAEEAARTTQIYAQEGLDPPANLSHHFEQLMLTIAHLYDKNPLDLDLVLDYWCPTEGVPNSSFPFRQHARQVGLFKFLRISGDNLSPTLFVAYVRMLCSLASSPRSARHCFNLLKQNGPVNGSNVSWDHFFTSLSRYYANLRQEKPAKTDTVYHHHRIHPKGITPQEIHGLQTVLKIICTVAENDELSRAAICENQDWQAINVLLGLVSCGVPVGLKAELINTLAALGRTPDTATILWHSIEAAQILSTVPSTSSYQSRGVQTELEEIESRAEEFPLTRAMLKLLDVLTNSSVPRLLGVGTRAPGFDPYLNYVLHSVFLRAPSRSYQKPQEKWEVMRGCLDLFVKFLVQYDPEPKDFETTRVELQSGGTSQVNPQPGYHLMVHLHSKSELLRLVLSLLEEGCVLLDTYAPQAGKEALEASMLGCLRLLERALALQQRFVALVNVAGSQLLLTGLSRLLLGLNMQSGKPDYMLCVAKYITYNACLPEHALSAVRILLAVTSYPKASSQLVGIFTSNQTLKLEIRHGFVECLEAEDCLALSDDEEVGVVMRTKEMILRLLQQCLGQPAPNLAHYLLGFQLNKNVSKTVFQQPGVARFPRTCLHSILTMLDLALQTRHTPYAANLRGSYSAAQAGILESSYGLLYNLCAGNQTSQPVLRFLRSCNNFLARHLAALPFNGPHHATELNQMSWLLKMVAIETKVSATKLQYSHLASLASILAGTRDKGQTEQADTEEVTDLNVSLNVSQRAQVDSAGSSQYDKLMLRLLALLDFSEEVTLCPNWEVFVPEQFDQVLKECENMTSPGLRLIDVRRLHHILIDHLVTVQGSSTAGQRQRIMEEIQEALKYAMDLNKHRTRAYANVRFMDAWRQAVEVLFCVAPLEVLPCPGRLQILLDTLHLLISKVLSFGDVPVELANLTSNALLLLLVNLRHSYVLGERYENEEGLANGDKGRRQTTHRDLDALALSGGVGDFYGGDSGAAGETGGGGRAVLEENSAKLNVILSGILQWMLRSGVASQKLRANLYSSLLTFMHIVCLPERSNAGTVGLPDPGLSFGGIGTSLSLADAGNVSSRHDQKSPLQASLDLVLGFGGRIVDVMCHDCTGGHDVCKMLTLSCLDKLIELDPHSSWVPFLSERGYLKHLIDSLLDSDANGQLEAMLFTTPESLRPLYVYESKMALLCRIASTRVGAEMLLEQKALSVLASMKVYDHHPIMHSGVNDVDTDSFIPSVGERYLQILLPALHLCDAVLSSLGVENQSCVAQVVHFLLCHVQTFGLVLGSGSPILGLNYLKELVHVTGVIARSANQDLYTVRQDDSTTALDRKAHLLRIQNLMLALFPHFIITESLIRKVRGSSTQAIARSEVSSQSTDERGEAVLHVLQVAAHLLLYAHNLCRRGKSDHRSLVPVFKPSLVTHHSHRTASDYSSGHLVGGERGGESQPVLGVVVDQLTASVAHHRKERATLELLTRKLASLPDLSSVELQEFLPEGTSAVEQRSLAAQQLRSRVEQKERELALTSYIVDNCLHLVWLHLDFYLHYGLPLNRASLGAEASLMPVVGAPMNATWQVSIEDISQLKQSLISVFNNNNTFCTQLVETKQNASEMESGFVEALLRRIIRLIQFVPVK